jgi:hypothetical protein
MKLLCALFLLLYSCNYKDEYSKNLEIKSEIEKFGKNHYINEVSDIKFSDSLYYIIDSKITSLFLLNQDLNLINLIGSKGKGPGEFLSMGSVAITSDKFYISDVLQNRVMCYNKSNYELLKKINLPEYFYLCYGDFFVDKNGYIPVAFITKNLCQIGMYNFNTQDFHPLDLRVEAKNIRLYRFICSIENDFFVAIPRYSNEISIFRLNNFVKLNEIKIDFPKETLVAWKNIIKKGKNSPLITDGCLQEEYIYLLYQDFANSSRGLAKIKLSSDFEIIYSDFSLFPKSNGDECIDVNNEFILTFSRRKSTIQRYHFKTNI